MKAVVSVGGKATISLNRLVPSESTAKTGNGSSIIGGHMIKNKSIKNTNRLLSVDCFKFTFL